MLQEAIAFFHYPSKSSIFQDSPVATVLLNVSNRLFTTASSETDSAPLNDSFFIITNRITDKWILPLRLWKHSTRYKQSIESAYSSVTSYLNQLLVMSFYSIVQNLLSFKR